MNLAIEAPALFGFKKWNASNPYFGYVSSFRYSLIEQKARLPIDMDMNRSILKTNLITVDGRKSKRDRTQEATQLRLVPKNGSVRLA